MSQFTKTIIIEDKSLAEKAADLLRDMIIHGECPQGSKLKENDFADAVGVSRACVREAFITLEGEGLIRRVHNKYTEVVSFSAKDIEDVYWLRTAIELMALELAMHNSNVPILEMKKKAELIENLRSSPKPEALKNWLDEDMNFHEMLVASSLNNKAIEVWKSVKNQVKMILYYAVSIDPTIRDSSENNNYHKTMVELIEQNKLEEGSRLLRFHITSSIDRIKSIMG